MLAMVQEGGGGNSLVLGQANELLNTSQDILEQCRENIRTWWTGALRDLVWRQIHMAETYIISMLPDIERNNEQKRSSSTPGLFWTATTQS
jgi:hypothetical protein